jgi:hypothetical protein
MMNHNQQRMRIVTDQLLYCLRSVINWIRSVVEADTGTDIDADNAAGQAAGRAGRLPRGCWSGYLTKYQYSGVRLSVGLCGVTPLRSFAISVTW